MGAVVRNSAAPRHSCVLPHDLSRRIIRATCLLLVAGVVALAFTGCSGDGSATSAPGTGAGAGGAGTTSGPDYTMPAEVLTAAYDDAAAKHVGPAGFDLSHLAEGYVAVSATAASRLKLQVSAGDMSYNYDLPQDGTPIVCPLNMGDGAYTFRVMQNTQGMSYVELARTAAQVALASVFEPYLRPSLFCASDDASAAVAQARELAAGAQNQGDVVRAVYTWLCDNISYDYEKAAQVADATGYVPNPDATLETRSGICFDYASLTAAMLRSLGIPCRIITGYVEPDGIYHAWNEIYIDGSWVTAEIRIDPKTWTRIDVTFAAADGMAGPDATYTDRYVY